MADGEVALAEAEVAGKGAAVTDDVSAVAGDDEGAVAGGGASFLGGAPPFLAAFAAFLGIAIVFVGDVSAAWIAMFIPITAAKTPSAHPKGTRLVRRFFMMNTLLSALDFVVPTDHKSNFKFERTHRICLLQSKGARCN
jgi:hypothetical protein